MKKLATLILVGIIIVSCGSRKKEIEKDKQEQMRKKKDLVINNLIKEYNITYQWDTLDFEYSFEYKPVLKSKYQIISDFVINDIYEKNDTLILSINTGYYPTFYFDFPITDEQAEIFKKFEYKWSDKTLIVVSIDKLRKIRFKLDTDAEAENDGDDSWIDSWINLEPSDDFIGKGKIFEIESLTD